MSVVTLVGMMGAGKTTTGRIVAKALGCRFDDLDHLIEAACGMSIPQIFSTRGEASFRAAERRELLRVLQSEGDRVLALGGGTPAQPGLMDMILGAGQVFWLRCPLSVLTQRVVDDGPHKRPLVASCSSAEAMTQALASRLAQRQPYYGRAHHILDVDGDHTPHGVAARILSHL